jgi:hypothetical protein
MNQFDSKAAYALNSLAITMMARSCFQLAADTLKDAVAIMAASQAASSLYHQSNVAEKLAQANSRIFNPEPASLLPVPVPINIIYHDGEVDISGDCGSSQFSAIRMEVNEESETEEATAVILYNLAICRLYQAKSISKAKNLLQNALTILNGLYNTSQCPFARLRLVVLMRIMSTALAQALDLAGLVQEATSLRTGFLVELESAAKAYATSELFSCTINAASPAA